MIYIVERLSFLRPTMPGSQASEAAAEIERLREQIDKLTAEYDHAVEQAAANADEVLRLRERVKVLEDALRKAADDMEGWGLYAPEYFREKHDFVGDVEAARAALGDKTCSD